MLVKLYSRYINCYDDEHFFDEYGFCFCEWEKSERYLCKYYEFCEDPVPEFCYKKELPDWYMVQDDSSFFENAIPKEPLNLGVG